MVGILMPMKEKKMVAHRESILLLAHTAHTHTEHFSTRLQLRVFTSCAMHYCYYYRYMYRGSYVRSSVDRLLYIFLKRF